MLELKRRFLLPLGVVTYFALATFAESAWPKENVLFPLWPLSAPLLTAFLLSRSDRYRNAHRIIGPVVPFELLLSGFVLYLIPVGASSTGHLSRLSEALALHLASLGALLLTVRLSAPPGFRRVPARASARDLQFVMSCLWIPVTLAISLQLLTPGLLPFSPLALDTAMTFSALGALFLLLAAEARVYVLRGLELGTLDRAKAGLGLVLTALLVAVGSVVLDVGKSDLIASSCLIAASVALGLSKVAPSPTRVTRVVRGLMALLLMGVPLAALLGFAALRLPERAATITFITFSLAALIGVVATAIARPLGPAGGRLLHSILRAEVLALDPDPDRAMTRVLSTLAKVEARAQARPEIFTANPGRLLWVETGGFVREKPAEFLSEIYRLARTEPFAVLRIESLVGAAVRQPEIREVLNWFLAHEAMAAVALREDEGAVGLLVLPKGRRKSWLSFEEAEALGRLGEKLTGLVSIHSALVRSQARDLASRTALERERGLADSMRAQFEAHVESQRQETERLALPLHVAGHSSRAIEVKRELDRRKASPMLELKTPPGVDAVCWAAYLHTLEPFGPFVVFDASEHALGDATSNPEHAGALWTAFERASKGTLLIIGAHLMTNASREGLHARMFPPSPSGDRPKRVLFSLPPTESLSSPAREVERVALPSLRERPEDLQPLIYFELARLGLLARGKPLGLSRAALRELLDQPFPGNELELLGILAAQVALAQGESITREELVFGDRTKAAGQQDRKPEGEQTAAPNRRRARSAPRSRY